MTIFLTSKINIDFNEELNEFELIKKYLIKKINQKFYIIEDSDEANLVKSLYAILITVTTIGLNCFFKIRRVIPYLYSPEDTYWFQMSILEFEPIKCPIIETYCSIEDEYLIKNIEILRESVMDIRLIE